MQAELDCPITCLRCDAWDRQDIEAALINTSRILQESERAMTYMN